MKTVCKKLFCLMLVAMLLVSAVPAAFAAGPNKVVKVRVEYTDGTVINDKKSITLTDGDTVTLDKALAQTLISDWTGREYVGWSSTQSGTATSISYDWAVTNVDDSYRLIIKLKKVNTCTHPNLETGTKEELVKATCTQNGKVRFECPDCHEKVEKTTPLVAHQYQETITKAATCTEKGVKTFTCSVCNDSYTEEIAKTEHTYVNGICTVCNLGAADYTLTFKYLNESGNWVTETQKVRNTETIEFPITPSVKGKRITGWGNEKNGTIYRTDTTYQWYVGYPVEYTAQYTETTDDNLATLTVWANFYVDGEYHHREQLLTKDFAKSSTSNSMFTWLYSEEGLTQVRDKVFAGGANSGYQWANQIYYNYYGDAAITKASMMADGDKHVYIKVTSTKSMEASVMLYVHLKQTETVDRVIPMPGYTAGDYVSYSAVKTAVKTKYTGSSMTVSDLYTEDEWDRLMDGQKVSGASSVKVLNNGTTQIHVIVKNATSKSSSTADSTNPKTGDYITIAVGTMALAGAALVTMVELKKRKMI